jgi:hypothetical protein
MKLKPLRERLRKTAPSRLLRDELDVGDVRVGHVLLDVLESLVMGLAPATVVVRPMRTIATLNLPAFDVRDLQRRRGTGGRRRAPGRGRGPGCRGTAAGRSRRRTGGRDHERRDEQRQRGRRRGATMGAPPRRGPRGGLGPMASRPRARVSDGPHGTRPRRSRRRIVCRGPARKPFRAGGRPPRFLYHRSDVRTDGAGRRPPRDQLPTFPAPARYRSRRTCSPAPGSRLPARSGSPISWST